MPDEDVHQNEFQRHQIVFKLNQARNKKRNKMNNGKLNWKSCSRNGRVEGNRRWDRKRIGDARGRRSRQLRIVEIGCGQSGR